MENTAILVDGGFYRKQAQQLFGPRSPEARADELIAYCSRHLTENSGRNRLYRIFYYDCPPSKRKFVHPLTGEAIDLAKTPGYKWAEDFFKELASKRKVALRIGEILESQTGYVLKPQVTKRLCRGEILFSEVTKNDFYLDIKQKGVDMRIGLDIASLAHKHLVSQIVLVAGDSDFVPAAKHARREGIDFVLDPLHRTIKSSLNEHIDGLRCKTGFPGCNTKDKLSDDYLPEQE